MFKPFRIVRSRYIHINPAQCKEVRNTCDKAAGGRCEAATVSSGKAGIGVAPRRAAGSE
jgi:hypothetical protein